MAAGKYSVLFYTYLSTSVPHLRAELRGENEVFADSIETHLNGWRRLKGRLEQLRGLPIGSSFTSDQNQLLQQVDGECDRFESLVSSLGGSAVSNEEVRSCYHQSIKVATKIDIEAQQWLAMHAPDDLWHDYD